MIWETIMGVPGIIIRNFKVRKANQLIRRNLCLDSDTLVIGIHGTKMNYYNTFYPMLEYFENTRFVPLTYNYKEDLDMVTEKLANRIKKFPFKKLVVVGYCYGGLVARYMLTKYFNDSENIKCITLGSANNGTKLKKNSIRGLMLRMFGIQPAEIKGSLYSNYLKTNSLKKTKVYSIWGKKDTVVSKGESRIENQEFIMMENENHFSLLRSKSVFRKIGEII